MIIDHVHKIEMNFTVATTESLTQVTLGDTAKSGNGFNGCIKGMLAWFTVQWTSNKL